MGRRCRAVARAARRDRLLADCHYRGEKRGACALRFRRYRGEVLYPPGVAHKPNAAKTNSFVFIAEAKRRRQRRPKRVGSNEIWDKAEAALAEATKLAGLYYILNPGEGAFYGPKSVQNECRRKMLAFFYDRVQPRTPSASISNSR